MTVFREEEESERRPLLERPKAQDGEGGRREEDLTRREKIFRWLGVFFSFAVIGSLDGAMYSFAVVFQRFLLKDLPFDTSEVKFLGSLQVGMSAVGALVATFIATKWGPKRGPKGTCFIGSLLAAVGWFTASYSKEHWCHLLTLGQILSGLGYGLMYTPPLIAIDNGFEKNKDLAMGVALSGAGVGQVFMSFCLHLIVTSAEWENTFRYILPGISVFFGVLGLLTPNPLMDEPEQPARPAQPAQPAQPGDRQVALYKNPNFYIFLSFCLGDCLAVAGLYLPYASMPGLVDIKGESSGVPAWLFLLGPASTVGRILSGIFCDWGKATQVSLKLTPICLFMACIFPVLLPLTYPDYVFYPLCSLFGLFTGAWIAATPSLITDLLGPKHLPDAFGWLTLARGIVACAAPPLVDLVTKLNFLFSSGFFLAAGIMSSLTSWYFFSRRAQRQESP